MEIDDIKLTLLTEANTQLGIPRNSIAKLEIHNGKKRHALLGLLIGAGTAAVIGAIEEPGCDGEDCYTRAENIGYGALGAGVVGLIAGALIKTDRRIEVPVEHFHVKVSGRRGGAAMSLTLSF